MISWPFYVRFCMLDITDLALELVEYLSSSSATLGILPP